MKAGLTVSTIFHAALLGFGLFSLSAPRALEVADVEAFPVDIVPVEEISQVQRGERDAPLAEQSAPTPTTRPEPVPDAQNVGDNTADLQSAPTPEPTPREVEAASAPPPSPEPAPRPDPAPEPEAAPAPAEPEPVPATERAPDPAPRQEVTPDPAPETAVAETPEAEQVQLPDTAPSPQARPRPPQAQTARAPERRDSERPAPRRDSPARTEESDFNADEVAALLNRQTPSGGGAQRSTEQAALGGRETTRGQQLTQSERDAIIAQLRSCWNVPAGAMGTSELKTTVRFRLDPSGTLEGAPVIEKASGDRTFDESTTRAIRICSQRGFQLPTDKYDTWSEVVVNFDPRDMF